jgi:hypothetical protein
MADTKLADLTALTTPSGDDILYIVDDPAGTPLDRKIALDNLFTRGTLNGTLLNMSQTWGGTGTYTGIKYDVTDSGPSNAASLLMDLQVGGASQFKVDKNGLLTIAAAANAGFDVASTVRVTGATGSVRVYNTGSFSFSSTGLPSGSADLIIGRRAAANLRLGAADTTGTIAPTPQFLSAQSWLSSTTNNQTGANFTIDGSQGTGTGAGGSIIFRVAPAGGTSNGVQNGLSTFLEATSARAFNLYGAFTDTSNYERLTLNFTASNDYTININKAGTGSNRSLTIETYGNSTATFESETLKLPNNGRFAFSSTSASRGSVDLILARDAANTLALRNGASAQAFRVYNTYTSDSVYERAEAFWSSNMFTLRTAQAGVGSSARSMTISTQGDANLLFSTNSVTRADFSSLGIKFYQHILLPTDNTYDIGAASADRPRNLFLGSYAQLSEMTAPAAPAANGVRIYAVDNGSGKTQLMALFATGAAQQIAIEP